MGAVLTHLSLAGGLDLERLPNGLRGGTQWVVAPGHLALHHKGQPTPAPHPSTPAPAKSQAGFGMLRSQATQDYTTPVPSA